MTNIVNSGSTLTVTNPAGLTLTVSSTVAAGGLLDGSGTITGGGFLLLNLGTISADQPGGTLAINAATLTNQGTIFSNNELLNIGSSVVLTNLSGSTLTGGVWDVAGIGTLSVLTGEILTDNATITLNGTAAALKSGTGTPVTIDNSLTTVGSSGVLNLLGGRSFHASNSLVVNGTLTMAGGGTLFAPTGGLTIGATGDLAGSGVIDPGTPLVDNGLIEAKGGTLTLPGRGSVSGSGTLQADAGASLVLQAFGGSYAGSIVNNGTIDAAFANLTGTLVMPGAYSGTGSFLIQGGFDGADRAILELPSGLSANVAFDTNFGELLLDAGATFNGTLSGFGNSDTIVLPGISNAAQGVLNGNVLDLETSGGSVVQALTLNTGSMDYSGASFTVTENIGNSQATVTASGVAAASCYAAGTRIRTEAGEVPVEGLAVGDIVHAHFAGATPVVWLGHRHVNCRRHPEPANVWPVRVAAHAFGPRTPSRDLVLSPDHAVFVDHVLIPIKHLINGKTIIQEKVDTVTYYHVELGEHDVLLAEGLPAESYLENGDRGVFDNAGGVVSLHPDFGARRWEAFGCAPLVVTGAKLDAVVARVRARMPKNRRGGAVSRRIA
jgi:collagen type I/II/III/V/XI/XXIV/XXVII alpha